MTNPANEHKLGTNFAKVYRTSDLARWGASVLPALQPPSHAVLPHRVAAPQPVHPFMRSFLLPSPGAWRV